MSKSTTSSPVSNPGFIPAGTAIVPQPDGKPIPSLFQPIKIRGTTFQNRIFVSPLSQYSSDNGKLTPWHMTHLSSIFTRGPGLTFIEATAVHSNGRISPEGLGLWSDEQIAPLKAIVDFAHSQGQKIGIQLNHAGRKASGVAPWISFTASAESKDGGWPEDVWGPSTIPYSSTYPRPKELTKEGINEIVRAWVEATKRALQAGVDVIEIHNHFGYLLHSFCSPVSNKRTDEYGNSFEGRVRLTVEIVDAVRNVIPDEMPLFVRISATDWAGEAPTKEPSWTLDDTVKLAGILSEHGVDLLDASTGGITPEVAARSVKPTGTAYFAHFAKAVKQAHGLDTSTRLFVSAVGGITDGMLAEDVIRSGQADVVMVGRQFQKEPASVELFASQLGVAIHMANQVSLANSLTDEECSNW